MLNVIQKKRSIRNLNSAAKYPFWLIKVQVSFMEAINFTQTLHDSKTILEVLEQYDYFNGKPPKKVFVDRVYKGIKEYKSPTIHIPNQMKT